MSARSAGGGRCPLQKNRLPNEKHMSERLAEARSLESIRCSGFFQEHAKSARVRAGALGWRAACRARFRETHAGARGAPGCRAQAANGALSTDADACAGALRRQRHGFAPDGAGRPGQRRARARRATTCRPSRRIAGPPRDAARPSPCHGSRRTRARELARDRRRRT